jgi:NADH-quinone oxidoreductase subunit M
MNLHAPWLQLGAFLPLAGAVLVGRMRTFEAARKWALVFSGATFACATAAWLDFVWAGAGRGVVRDSLDLVAYVTGSADGVLGIDALSAPLLPLTAFLFLCTAVVTARVKKRQFSFAWNLAAEGILLATFCCKEPWAVVGLLIAGTVPPYVELRQRGAPTGVYVWHMGLFAALLALGWALAGGGAGRGPSAWVTLLPLVLAVLLRGGVAPLHCWATDLFERGSFGTAVLFVAPMPAAYAALRLVAPVSPDGVLRGVGLLALVTALYAAGMALVQKEARRFFCYLFLSHSALVLVGLDTTRPVGLTGALTMWLALALTLSGFGLTLRALESRHGRLSLTRFHGLYDHKPALAGCFLLTGLASVGFPGTVGFLGAEMVVDGTVGTSAYVGVVVVLAAALNGIAVVRAYFLLFNGTRHVSSVPLGVKGRERVAVLALAGLVFLGGLFPQAGVSSRYQAALEVLEQRKALRGGEADDVSARSRWRLLRGSTPAAAAP